MSIEFEPFASAGVFPTYPIPRPRTDLLQMVVLHCQRCGYEAPDPCSPPRRCPRCYSGSLVRTPIPGSLLRCADRSHGGEDEA